MITLSREIRFALVPPTHRYPRRPANSWSGWPSSDRVVPQLKLLAQVEGTPDKQTGYVCNVAELDTVIRAIVVDHLIPKFGAAPHEVSGAVLLGHVFSQFQQRWHLPGRVASLALQFSQQLSWTLFPATEPMLQLTQQFEFSAAHRLHCDSMTDQQNRDLFGKCNNPNGHGHNYVFDVTVQPDGRGDIDLTEFQNLVKTAAVDRLDHKHLNIDVACFADVNPTVENIVVVVFDWINHALQQSDLKARLVAVKLFETPKTWAEYRGQ